MVYSRSQTKTPKPKKSTARTKSTVDSVQDARVYVKREIHLSMMMREAKRGTQKWKGEKGEKKKKTRTPIHPVQANTQYARNPHPRPDDRKSCLGRPPESQPSFSPCMLNWPVRNPHQPQKSTEKSTAPHCTAVPRHGWPNPSWRTSGGYSPGPRGASAGRVRAWPPAPAWTASPTSSRWARSAG